MSRAREFPATLIWLVWLTMLLAPLPLASNRPLFEALIICSAGFGLLLWSFHYIRTGEGLLLEWRNLKGPGLCVIVVLLWSIVQLIPLPAPYAHPIWQETSALLERPLQGRITVDASATLWSLLKLAAFIAFFALAFQLGRSTHLAGRALRLLFMGATIYAGYGLAAYLSGNAYVLWLAKEAYPDSLTGTFINRGGFAALCGMGLLAGLALLTRWSPRRWYVMAGCAVLLLALLFTQARAGIVAALLGALVFGFCAVRAQLIPRKIMLLSALALVATLGGLLALAGQTLLTRLDTAEFAQDERPGILRSTVQMITDAPLTGQGLGTYDQLFHVYRDDMTFRIYDHAHNTYLEMAAEIGLPATALWFFALILIGLRLWRGVSERRQSQLYPAFVLAVLVMAGSHALLDFSYQLPANALWLAIILGVGTAQSFRSAQ